jgi:hypothetical protein
MFEDFDIHYSYSIFIVFYCAREILTCKPALVVVMGADVAIFGITLFCSK